MAGMEFGGSKVFPTDTIRPSMSKYSSENLLYMGIWRIRNRNSCSCFCNFAALSGLICM